MKARTNDFRLRSYHARKIKYPKYPKIKLLAPTWYDERPSSHRAMPLTRIIIMDISKNICLPYIITNPPSTAKGMVLSRTCAMLECKRGLKGIPLSPVSVRGNTPQLLRRCPREKFINSIIQISATNPRIQYIFFFICESIISQMKTYCFQP